MSTDSRLVSAKNTVVTALTGRTVLLPTEDADRYQHHCETLREEWNPKGQRELLLVQSAADNAWRIERIASFEMALFAKERSAFANVYREEPEPLRSALIEMEIARINERELRHLALQETRLRRQRDRDIAELRYLQAERKRLTEERLALAAEAMKQAKAENKPFTPSEFGFVFSTAEIERFLVLQKAKKALRETSTPNTPARSLKK